MIWVVGRYCIRRIVIRDVNYCFRLIFTRYARMLEVTKAVGRRST